jgi:hypothetical protein
VTQKDYSTDERLAGTIIATLVISVFLYGAFFGVVYLSADRVECGSIGPVPYCSGVYKDVSVNESVVVERNVSEYRSTTCYRNGEQVNCSENFVETNQNYYEEEFE